MAERVIVNRMNDRVQVVHRLENTKGGESGSNRNSVCPHAAAEKGRVSRYLRQSKVKIKTIDGGRGEGFGGVPASWLQDNMFGHFSLRPSSHRM